MPIQDVALFVRPNFDAATSYAHYYMDLAAEYAAQNMRVIDLDGVGANKSNIFASLEGDDPIFCYWNGHGNADTFTAQNAEVVMVTCSGDESLIGRVVLLLSCSCGIRLAPSAVSKGATTVFGWAVDFTWVAIEAPATDPYARGFFESVNAISNALAYGKTTQEAMNLSLAAWNSWIDYWASSVDPYASMVIQWLIHDRDGQKLFGSTSARITTP
ncbi:unnamed protein product, partial [marine sediment metagenome]